MATFIKLPVELRREIYRYLLSSSNVSEKFGNARCAVRSQGCVLQIPQISTSLFTVNKQISSEALQYFYQQNAFVAINITMGHAFRHCKFLFPCFSWLSCSPEEANWHNRTQCIEKVGLVITWDSRGTTPDVASVDHLQTLLFSIRYLPAAIRILNNEQFPSMPSSRIEVQLNLRLGSSYCEGYSKFLDDIVSSLKNVKSHSRSDKEPDIWFSVSGDIDKERSDSIKSIPIHRHDRTDPILRSKWAIEMGDTESIEGNFAQAENYYDMATRFIDLFDYPLRHETHLISQCRVLKIQGHLKAASNCQKAKDYEWACVRAAIASKKSQNIYPEEAIDDKWVRMNHQAAMILSEPGDYEREKNLCRALDVLDKAISHADDAGLRQDIAATRETVEAKLRDLGVDDPVPLGVRDLIVEHGPPHVFAFVPSAG